MSEHRERIQVLAAGIFSLVLVLGVARFAYTPLLPLMQQQAEEPMEGAEIVEFALLGPVGTTKPRRRGLP